MQMMINMNIIQSCVKLIETARLHKLKMPKLESKEEWRDVLTEWATEKGYQQVGSGTYGLVFYSRKNPKEVIKIFTDISYYKWIEMCRGPLKGNPYVCVFKGKPIKIYPNHNIWAVRIEKLKTANRNTLGWSQAFRRYLEYKETLLENARNANFKSKNVGEPTSVKEFRNKQSKENMKYIDQIVDTMTNYLSKGENILHFFVDVHVDNVMQRGTHPVIIDPLSMRSKRSRELNNMPILSPESKPTAI